MRGRNKAPVLAWRLVGSYGNQSRAFYVRDHVNSPPTFGKSTLTSNHQIAKHELLQCPLITHFKLGQGILLDISYSPSLNAHSFDDGIVTRRKHWQGDR